MKNKKQAYFHEFHITSIKLMHTTFKHWNDKLFLNHDTAHVFYYWDFLSCVKQPGFYIKYKRVTDKVTLQCLKQTIGTCLLSLTETRCKHYLYERVKSYTINLMQILLKLYE